MAERDLQNARAKLSEALADFVLLNDGVVEVIVELRPPEPLAPGMNRAERIAAAREHFEDDSYAIKSHIDAAGGTVLDELWLNHTLRTLLPIDAVAEIAADESVEALDLPRELSLD